MSITPEQFKMLSFGQKTFVIFIMIFEIWLEIAKIIWPILICRILSVLKDIRTELKKKGEKK
ncbi:hypothetical protein [Tissierella praeacuta]|uniref:hypothetical protein n=1 Tax=Tissierella praeacuta TaxID=43131 RepID=UPI00333F111E